MSGPARHGEGMLQARLPALADAEGARVADGLPPVIDAHVHIFPGPLFAAVWRWFDEHGWPIRYRLDADALIAFLRARGVAHLVLLCYAHRPGAARELNRFVAALAARHAGVTGLATVLPGEPGAAQILEQAFAAGLAGVKLHPHVQCFDLDSAAAHEVYACCAANDKPLLMHAGREPKSPAYACDPYALCGAAKVARLLRRHRRLRLCVPHLGVDELAAFRALAEEHDTLWLDTAMALAGYLPGAEPLPLASYRADRLIYGSDFPNIPYAWDRELRALAALGLSQARLERLLFRNAAELFRIAL